MSEIHRYIIVQRGSAPPAVCCSTVYILVIGCLSDSTCFYQRETPSVRSVTFNLYIVMTIRYGYYCFAADFKRATVFFIEGAGLFPHDKFCFHFFKGNNVFQFPIFYGWYKQQWIVTTPGRLTQWCEPFFVRLPSYKFSQQILQHILLTHFTTHFNINYNIFFSNSVRLKLTEQNGALC